MKIRQEEVDGVKEWLWPVSDNGLWDGPSREWSSFRDKILEKVPKRRVVIQAGGGCGMYPRLLSQMFDRVYTFEPDHQNFHCLVNNCPGDKVIKINAALGSWHDMVHVERQSPANLGMHYIIRDRGGTVPQLLIDDLDSDDVDLLWFDIEGSEYAALEGAERTLRFLRPAVLLENGDKGAIPDLMQGYGYKKIEGVNSDTLYLPK